MMSNKLEKENKMSLKSMELSDDMLDDVNGGISIKEAADVIDDLALIALGKMTTEEFQRKHGKSHDAVLKAKEKSKKIGVIGRDDTFLHA